MTVGTTPCFLVRTVNILLPEFQRSMRRTKVISLQEIGHPEKSFLNAVQNRSVVKSLSSLIAYVSAIELQDTFHDILVFKGNNKIST